MGRCNYKKRDIPLEVQPKMTLRFQKNPYQRLQDSLIAEQNYLTRYQATLRNLWIQTFTKT